MKRARGWLALTCLLSLASCTAAPPGERLAGTRELIVGGEVSPAGGAEDAVVLLLTRGPDIEQLCSGSLVAPNLVMTARHCVSHVNQGQFRCSVRGEPIDNPTGGGGLGLHLPAQDVKVYGAALPRSKPLARGKALISTLSATICVNDLAFVVLDRSLDLPVLPLRIGRPAESEEAVTLVGYGVDGKAPGIDFLTQLRHRKPGLSIHGVGPDALEDGVTTVPPRALIIEGVSGCVGDSGGPLLAERTLAVLGVYSLLDGDSCDGNSLRHQLVHVPPFEALIAEAFAAAGAEPTLEPPPLPFGEPCGEPDECADKQCAAFEGAEAKCTTACSARAPCPDGFDCVETQEGGSRRNLCAPTPVVDAGTDAADPPPEPRASDAGCAMASGGNAGPGALATTLLLLFGLRRRRL